MKGIKLTEPVRETETTVDSLFVRFSHRRVEGKPPVRHVTLKLTAPLNGKRSLQYIPGEPGFDELAKALDIEAAIGASLKASLPDATISDLPVKTEKKPAKKTGKK